MCIEHRCLSMNESIFTLSVKSKSGGKIKEFVKLLFPSSGVLLKHWPSLSTKIIISGTGSLFSKCLTISWQVRVYSLEIISIFKF